MQYHHELAEVFARAESLALRRGARIEVQDLVTALFLTDNVVSRSIRQSGVWLDTVAWDFLSEVGEPSPDLRAEFGESCDGVFSAAKELAMSEASPVEDASHLYRALEVVSPTNATLVELRSSPAYAKFCKMLKRSAVAESSTHFGLSVIPDASRQLLTKALAILIDAGEIRAASALRDAIARLDTPGSID